MNHPPTIPLKKFLYYFTPIAIINLIVFFPSFFHMPRGDQVIFLANIAPHNDWFSFLVEIFDFNRRDPIFGEGGDLLLFRPLYYMFLGLEQWMFGYNFMLWQIAGVALHLMVVWLLLKYLLKIKDDALAFFLVLFFSVMFAGCEMVIWTSVNSYMLLEICILISLPKLQNLSSGNAFTQKDLIVTWLCVMVGAFFYEFGVVYSVLVFIFFIISRKPLQVKEVVLFSLPFVLYVILSYLNFMMNHVVLSSEGQTILTPTQEDYKVLPAIFLSIFWWLYNAIFVNQIVVLPEGRTQIYPSFMFLNEPSAQANPIPVIIGAGTLLFLCVLIVRGIIKGGAGFSKKYAVFIIVIILSYASMIALGRVKARGVLWALGWNPYYHHIFWVLFIILVYCLLSSQGFARAQTAFIQMAIKSVLVILIILNSTQTMALSIYHALVNDRQRRMLGCVDGLVRQKHKEQGFSFYLDPLANQELRAYGIQNYIGNKVFQKSNLYTLAELYYSQYLASNPAYTISVGQDGNCKIMSNQ